MSKRTIIISILFFIVGVCEVLGQFSIDAQLRPRTELRRGYKKLHSEGDNPSFLTSQRTRLVFGYETQSLRVRLSPQDVRVWGDESLAGSTGVYGDNASLDLHEAVAEVRLSDGLWLSVGRQELVYDNEWLLAARNWNQNGLSYDAVLFKASVSQFDLHLAGSWNSASDSKSENYYFPDRIKTLDFLWLNRKFQNKARISFLHIASGVTETDTTNRLRFRQTSGLHGEFKHDGFKGKADVYYQYGKSGDASNVSAFLADADLSYNYQQLTFGAGYSYLSGNRNVNSSKDKLFDVLYGARHRFLGHMDYFGSLDASTKEGGIVDGRIYLAVKPFDNVQLQYTGHYFRLAERNANTPQNKNLGVENELELRYKFNSWGSLKAAYLFYLPTQTFETIQGVENSKFAQFAFIELTINPRLFMQQ